MKGHRIVKKVFESFPGLPEKLSRLFGKSDTWYRSHSYELRSENPLANGNLSAVDHVLRMADEYEASAPGAGKLLGEELAAEFRARYSLDAPADDRKIRRDLMKEFFEALDQLEKSDLKDKSDLELAGTDAELAHIETAIGTARAATRAELRKRTAANVREARFGR